MATIDSEFSYEFSDQYLIPDFPSKYREIVLKEMINDESFILKVVHEFFQSGKYKGERMVEVGCGPTIHKLAIPSRYYDEIITSDYTSENRDSVKKWIAGDPEALDWTPLLEIVAANEGYSDLSLGVKDVEARIRRKVKSVIHCDVLKKTIFDPDIEEVDLLLTSGCLEGACPTRESFASALKNLGSYVKSGGYIMMFTVIGMSSVEFDGKDMKVLSVDEDFIQSALKAAGFAQDQRFYRENHSSHINFQGLVFLTAKKL